MRICVFSVCKLFLKKSLQFNNDGAMLHLNLKYHVSKEGEHRRCFPQATVISEEVGARRRATDLYNGGSGGIGEWYSVCHW